MIVISDDCFCFAHWYSVYLWHQRTNQLQFEMLQISLTSAGFTQAYPNYTTCYLRNATRDKTSIFAHYKQVISPYKYLMVEVTTVTGCYSCTVVSRKSAHGRKTLQVCQRGGQALFLCLTTKNTHVMFTATSTSWKQSTWQMEPPVASKLSLDNTQHP